MAELPRGTVTFVFTDIEGSTALVKRLRDRYGEVVEQHQLLLRTAFAEHAGHEIDTQGDSFFFAFARARDAVAAAVKAQRAHAEQSWPGEESVRVRMGLHTGEPAVGAEGYLGVDVVRAARICGSGHGGNVLLSEATRALLGSSLPEGVSVHAVGERQLKDIDEPERVYELAIEGVEQPQAEAPASVEDEDEWDIRAADFKERMREKITKNVFESLERSLGAPDGARPESARADSGRAEDP